jgi:hypothetical protein
VSIAGAMRETQGHDVSGRRIDVKELPNIEVNGEYIRTSHIVNGYPVYVKINGQQWTVPPVSPVLSVAQSTELLCDNSIKRVCLMMNVARDAWCLKPSAVPEESVCFSRISIPFGAASKQLEDLATQHELKLLGYPEATVSLKSIADTMAGIASAATTHAQRKDLVAKQYECQGCTDEKPFSDFIALPCGHALLCRECHLGYLHYRRTNPNTSRSNCSKGCSVPMHSYRKVTEHSDFAPLYMADPAAAPAAATGNRFATGNRYATGICHVVKTRASIVAV